MDPREQTFIETLRTQGYKLTKARRAVIRVLTSASEPLSINDLHDRARELDPDLGLVTVYRTLELLVGLNLTRPVHFSENCHGYAVATPGHTHHLVCRRCHAVVEFEGCDLAPLLDEVARRTGYYITDHWLELEGVCAACKAAQS